MGGSEESKTEQTVKDHSQAPTCKERVQGFLKGNFFFVAFAVVIPFAWGFPDVACTGGLIHPEISVFWVDIMGIFFIEGLTLPTGPMIANAPRFGFHAMTQLFNLCFIPLVVWAVVSQLHQHGYMSHLVRDGFLAMGFIPSTTSMCVMLSGRSGGNAPLAALNAIMSNTIAIFYTPLLLATLTLTDSSLSQTRLAIELAIKMIGPQCLGQLVRTKWGANNVMKNMPKIGMSNQMLILILLFQILSDVFKQGGSVDGSMLLQIIIIVFILHYFFFGLAWGLGGLFLGSKDRVAFVFSGTTKTVVLGVPMLRVVYANRSPGETAVLLLPLITYHLLELVNGLTLSSHIRTWVAKSTGRGEKQALIGDKAAVKYDAVAQQA